MTLVKHSLRTVRKACDRCGHGAGELYWAHDTDRHYYKTCETCNVNGRFVLIDRSGNRHDCQGDGGQTEQTPDTTDVPDVPEPMPAVAPTAPVSSPTPTAPAVVPMPTGTDGAFAAFQALLNAMAPKVDAEQVRDIIDERLAGIGAMPLRVEIVRDGVVKPIDGTCHQAFPKVLSKVLAYRKAGKAGHVYMHGPGGTGKTSIAPQVAEALGLDYYPISLGPTMTESKLMGYCDANGNYHETAWVKALRNGGLVLLDECDSANAAVLTVADAALANGHVGLPDGTTVEVSPDFIVLAAGNTTGNGPDRMYVGRQAQDKAFLDRFTFVLVDYDLSLERAMCLSTGADDATVNAVLDYVREVRSNILALNLPVLCGMRATIGACAELAGGIDWDDVVDGRIRHGMSDADWRKVSEYAVRPTAF